MAETEKYADVKEDITRVFDLANFKYSMWRNIRLTKEFAEQYYKTKSNLEKNYINDENLRPYILKMPKVWILKNYNFEIVFFLLAVICFALLNVFLMYVRLDMNPLIVKGLFAAAVIGIYFYCVVNVLVTRANLLYESIIGIKKVIRKEEEEKDEDFEKYMFSK